MDGGAELSPSDREAAKAAWRETSAERLREKRRLERERRDVERARAERERFMAAKYRADHSEQHKAYMARYRVESADKIRLYRLRYNEIHAERLAQQKREWHRRQRVREKADERRRQANRDHVRRYREAHPEETAARARRWREANPDKMREYGRRYYERNRDAVLARATQRRDEKPEETAAAMKKWQAENKTKLADYQRTYRSNPEKYARALEANREGKKMRRRLQSAGLPPRSIQRVAARDRRANQSAANEFFQRRRTLEERHRIMENFEPTPPEKIREWKVSSNLARRRFAQIERFPTRVQAITAKHGDRIREDVQMDSKARELRGLSPLDVEAETQQRIAAAAGLGAFMAVAADPAKVSMVVEAALAGVRLDDEEIPLGSAVMEWVPGHTRQGVEVQGYWRRRKA